MYFYQVLQQLNKTKFVDFMKKWNVSEHEQNEYLLFIERLLEKEPVKSEHLLMVNEREDEVEVYVQKEESTHAIDFVPWEEVLGYRIASVSFIEQEEYAFHVLYDMSFDGFYEDEREEKINEIEKRIEEVESGKTEWVKFESMDELFEEVKKRANFNKDDETKGE